jgi:hypothetical protein
MIGLDVRTTLSGPFCSRCGEAIPVRQIACDCPAPCGAVHLEVTDREAASAHKTCEPRDER